ncbi:MAG: hypothetical protein JEZ03_07710 [Bacteroidales bacterium]|nr:hypothetical protein [Bacteroidales bacterium]
MLNVLKNGFILCFIVLGLTVSAQNNMDVLQDRFKAYFSFDSLSAELTDSNRVELMQIIKAQGDIISLDNKIISELIENPEETSKDNRHGVLIREINNKKAEIDKLKSKNNMLLIFVLIAIGGLCVVGYFYYVLYRDKRESKKNLDDQKKRFNLDYEEFESLKMRVEHIDSKESEMIQELEESIGDYKSELEKAGKFIHDFRTEKANIENELEEVKGHNIQLLQQLDFYKKKVDQVRTEDKSENESLKREKQRSEDNFNELHAQSKRIADERDKLRLELDQHKTKLTREKEDKETVKKELLEWIESKKGEFSTMENQIREANQQVRTMRFELNHYITEKTELESQLKEAQEKIQNSEEIKEKEIKEILSQVENQKVEFQQLTADLERMKNETTDLNYRLDVSERNRKTLDETAKLHQEAHQREIEKRRKLEDQLSGILKNLKGSMD